MKHTLLVFDRDHHDIEIFKRTVHAAGEELGKIETIRMFENHRNQNICIEIISELSPGVAASQEIRLFGYGRLEEAADWINNTIGAKEVLKHGTVLPLAGTSRALAIALVTKEQSAVPKKETKVRQSSRADAKSDAGTAGRS